MQKPSKYQKHIHATVVTTNKSVAVKAGPGSGKTTTIVQCAKIIPYSASAIFVAFNKSIVKELKERLPATVHCNTMHSVGTRSIFQHYPGEHKINDNKQIGFIEPYFEKDNKREKWRNVYQVDDLIKKMRDTMCKIDKESINTLISNYALDVDDIHINVAMKALRKFYEWNDDPDRYNITIDFRDMIEMCVRNKDILMPQYEYVFIDEVQDLSKLDQQFVERLVKPRVGRKIVVGDPKQSIYGFRGSDPNSFETFVNQPNTIQLPLSISYRCSKNIVREAKKIYDDIEEYEENEEGALPRKGKIEEIQEGDMVLCRNTRPLIDIFFKLILNDKKAYVVGKEMEKGLLAMLASFESEERTSNCLDRLINIKVKVANKLKEKGILSYDKHPKYIAVQEKIHILQLLFDKCETIDEVEQFIKLVFDNEEREGACLMTIHRSKGLENDRVFFVRTYEGKKLIPSPYAVTKDQLRQEKNLQFVGTTRAKKELIYIDL